MLDGRNRVIIENLQPRVDFGLFPAKRAVGELVMASADVLVDGHDVLRAVLLHRRASHKRHTETPMRHVGNDRWQARFPIEHLEPHFFTVEAWVDRFATWLAGLEKKAWAGQNIALELKEGALLVRAAASRAKGRDATFLTVSAKTMEGANAAEALDTAMAPLLAEAMGRWPDRSRATRFGPEAEIQVDPAKALFSTWYEIFPRSAPNPRDGHGTFRDVQALLPEISRMGFDVLYLPPIHPIGTTRRKGRNNSPECGPRDPGNPWAIGSAEGGHKAVHPELGSLADFRALVKKAHSLDIDLALDMAFQCSPDHPWVAEHPEWFRTRPDGSIQYAENPPKKYQDVYPFDFECEDWRELWNELKGVVLFWAEQGVRFFRVDTPHTKPLEFWRWCIGEVKREYPDAVFLAEAFTRPRIMYRLAKAGFTQSYTYFTWRNTKAEVIRYMTELVRTAPRDYFRPNFWPNTPDILPEVLQYGGRAAFITRLVLAATMSASYGVYGPAFELCETDALPGTEEYNNSEKYEIKNWDRDRVGNLRELIGLVNRVRRETPALQTTWNLRFLESDNDFVLWFAKHTDDLEEVVLVAVNLDPYNKQGAWLHLPLDELGVQEGRSFLVHDLLGDDKFVWHGARNYLELDPAVLPARIFRLRKRLRRETDFDYFM